MGETEKGSYCWDRLPKQVLSCNARILLVKDFLECGIVLLEGANPAFCLFRSSHFVRPRGDLAELSKWLAEGTSLRVNAKKENNSKMVPFLATSVWFEGEDLGHVNASKNFLPTSAEDLETFERVADDLTWELKPMDKELLNAPVPSKSSNSERDNHRDKETSKSMDRRSPDRRSGHSSGRSKYGDHRQDDRGRDYDRKDRDYRSSERDDRGRDYRSSERDDRGRDYRSSDRDSKRSDRDYRGDSGRDGRGSEYSRGRRTPDERPWPAAEDRRGVQERRTSEDRKYSGRPYENPEFRERTHHRVNPWEKDGREGRGGSNDWDSYRTNDMQPEREKSPKGARVELDRERSPRGYRIETEAEQSPRGSNNLERSPRGSNHLAESHREEFLPPFGKGNHTPEDNGGTDHDGFYSMEEAEESARTSSKRGRSASPAEQALPAPKKIRFLSPDRENPGLEFIKVHPLHPCHTSWRGADPELIAPSEFKEVPVGVEGHAVVLDRWEDTESGVLCCKKTGHLIVFNFNQMWEQPHKSSGWFQMREIYSSMEARIKFPMGSKLRCFYRKQDLGQHGFQATLVWKEGPSPKNFRTKEYFGDLQRLANNMKHNRDIAPGLFSLAREGVVQEFISYETGLIRLLDEDKAVAHFAVDQLWEGVHKGKGNYLVKNNSRALESYLPIGTRVVLLVRSIAHDKSSQLRYQTSLVWRAEFGTTMPPEFSAMVGLRQTRVDISKQLDTIHDRFKQNALLSVTLPIKYEEPVIVSTCLNLLPSEGKAKILGQLSSEASHIGTIQVSVPEFADPNKMMKMFAIFHIEDVYDTQGKQIIQSVPGTKVSDLKDVEVNLIARSIAVSDSYSALKGLADKLGSSPEYKDAKIPLLQAVSVFLVSPTGKINTGVSPLPTFFRREPSSLNRKQLGTAFYFNLSLRCRLDLKVYEYLECCSNHVSNASKLFHHPRFFDPKIMIPNRKQGPRACITRLSNVDVNGDVRHNYGAINPAWLEDPPPNLPGSLGEQGATVKFIWLERPNPKYGLMKVLIGNESALAFFSVNAINSKRFLSSVSTVFWKNMKNVCVNVELMDPDSKIPYVVTEAWVLGDRVPNWVPPASLKDEWTKVISLMLSDNYSLNFKASEITGRLKLENLKEERALKSFESPVEEKTGWRPSLKSIVGKVEKIMNNFACASSYQDIDGTGEKRYFVLFDICDVFINNDLAVKSVKSLKEAMSEGDFIRFNAVHVAAENSWNLNYLATAVVTSKADPPPALPLQAPYLPNSASLKPEKVKNFNLVMAKIVKKEPPADNRVLLTTPQPRGPESAQHPRGPESAQQPRGPESAQQLRPQERKYPEKPFDAQRYNHQRTIETNRIAEQATKLNLAKRTELMKSKPEIYRELRSMEINRSGNFFYDCKSCGIQGMSIDDAEDHISSEMHREKRSVMTEETGSKKRFQDRSEAEEALFIHANKSVTLEERNGRKFYSCSECKAEKMSFLSAKKHVLSLAHKKKDRNNLDSAILDQECREMRKVGRNGVHYFCQPCAFTTESIVQNKEHIAEPGHKRLTTCFCHVCKEFKKNRSEISDHRFSILHKKNFENLEEQCSKALATKPTRVTKLPPVTGPAEPNSSETAETNGGEDNLLCKYCNYSATDRYDRQDHENTASHKRRYFIQTQQMPAGGIDRFASKGERCNTIEEMCLVREGKDIAERADKEASLRLSEEVKQSQENLLNKLFDGGVFTQMEKKTSVRCNTCKTLLNGKEKQLTRQLLAHLVGDKHRDKLRVQIKAEENTGVDRNTAQQQEEEEEEAARAAKSPSPVREPEAVEAPVPSRTASTADILAWLKTQSEVLCTISDRLCYCLGCKTGLKPVRECFRHMLSEVHRQKMVESREWRLYVDLMDVLELGDTLFKCLPCNTEYLRRRELELHLGIMEHLQRFVDEEKDRRIEASIPTRYPECAQCEDYFATEAELKIHEKFKHRKDYAFTPDQIENLKALSQSRNLTVKPTLDRVEGRVLQILPSSNLGIIQVSEEEEQYVNVLFDLSRLQMKHKEKTLVESVSVGYPVLLNAVEMDPNPGYSENIAYYASAVTLGDEDDHNGLPSTFSSLQSEIGPTILEAQRYSKAALLVELDMCAQGAATPIFHSFSDVVEFGTGVVVMKNQSVMLVRLQQEKCFALQILESLLLTESSDTESSSETFEVGDSLHFNAVLVNPEHPTQYLITGCWGNTESRSAVPRSRLALRALDMYHTLAASYCADPSSFALMDLSNVLLPTEFGVGFDDIAADMEDISGGILAGGGEETEPTAGPSQPLGRSESPTESETIPFVRIKIASFAKKSD